MAKENSVISFRIPAEEKHALEEYCAKNDLSMSQVIRRAIKEYLNK